ncbi:uncharacterized protein LOC105353719 [Oryzias latipes]|uniref:uncharacterized protein LOC105353719 n=1 Tax=Oryzias latipes TaxID=8090 RepID=UPI000CE212BD|nr:uncharacterized protein LOC105353719 [Oryzias latipes]
MNITFIKNSAVRDTILNVTLTALAPKFANFQPGSFKLWFQNYLVPVIASLNPVSLWVIPSNISCASYEAILSGLQQSLRYLPLDLSMSVRSSIESLQKTFTACSLPDSFKCKESPVDENLICAGTYGLPLDQTVDIGNSSAALCNFTITEHACSSAEALTPRNVATLLECSLERQQTYPVEVWKLFFQRISDLDQALDTLSTMNPTIKKSSPTLSNALEALGEVKVNKFSQAELLSQDSIASWFQNRLRLFLASPTTNFLTCLSSNNFSCVTYQIVIKAFGTQKAVMDSGSQRAVFTHFIIPFLSRKDSSDPGCISSVGSGDNWLQANVGAFSEFAELKELLAINPNFSSLQYLSELTPSQVATLVLRLGSSNDTDTIDQVFERLDTGNALQNVDQFLTNLTLTGKIPVFQPAVRDRIMNRTFIIISQQLAHFSTDDFYVWFNVKLTFILTSFTPEMLRITTSSINCISYRVVVSGLASVYTDMTRDRQAEIAQILLDYLKTSAAVINTPGTGTQQHSALLSLNVETCRHGEQGKLTWLALSLI